MCHYIKDNGEQCGRAAEPYCHQHEDTVQAALYERTTEKFGDSVEPTLLAVFWKAIEDKLEAAASDAEAAFKQQTVEHTCDDCEAPVRRCVRHIGQSDYSREMAEVIEGLTCQCGHFVRHDRTGGRIEKSKLPDAWL